MWPLSFISEGDFLKHVEATIGQYGDKLEPYDLNIKMQSQLLADDDCACFLVEVIAKKSQNISWAVTVDGGQRKHRRIRRISLDRFYALVTGQEDAFYQMCMVLPRVIETAVNDSATVAVPKDSVIECLGDIAQSKDGSFALALYMLGFSSYLGFK